MKRIACQNFGLFATGGLVVATIISALALSSTNTKAVTINGSTASVNASVTVGEACTISGTGMNTHTATIANKTYQANIGETTIKVSCNDANGFSIYAIGYTGEEYSGTNHTKLVGTRTNETIATGTATSAGNPDVSNWAMKLSAVSGTYTPSIITGFSSYHAIPDTYTKVATRTSGTDAGSNPTGSSIKTTYAAYISATQPADTYNGKVKYTLVHPASEEPLSPQPSTAGCINYHANASSAVGTMGCQSATDGASIDLLASNFSRAGYGFAGWSDSYDYATNANAKFYGPQETITAPTGTTANGLSLYAVWVKSQGNLQDTNKVSSVCSALDTAPANGTANLESISALTDQRDNETYAIAKLADGNCWMIENLRLESTNSDNATGALAQGYGTSTTYGNFSGLANAENANFSNSTTANTLYYSGTQDGTASIDIGTTNYPGYRMPRYNSDNHQATSEGRPQNPTSNSASNSTTSASMYSYGNYYTWAAAMANTGYYNTTTTDEYGYTPSEAANTSLCPKGWKLPYGRSTGKGATSGGFSNLDIALGGTGANSSSSTTPTGTEMSKSWRAFPNNFLYSGHFNGSSASNRGSDGYYWSSTASSYRYSYLLLLYSSNVGPGTSNYNKYNGQSIRCVASSS